MAKTSVKSKKISTKPVWLKYTEQEVREIISNIAKKQPELGSEKIGIVLRDSYGIPKTKLYGLKIGKILKEAGIYKSSDEANLVKKVKKLEAHVEKNKQDQKTKRALTITKSKLKKTKEYLAKKKK